MQGEEGPKHQTHGTDSVPFHNDMMGMAAHANAKLLSGATHDDLQKCARQVTAPNESILAVWRVNEQDRSNAAYSIFPAPLLLPCFWPHLCVLSPCVCAAVSAQYAILKGTLYFLTNKNLGVIVDAAIGPCGVCMRTGVDSGSMPLTEIRSVGINAKGGGACLCCPFSALMVGTPLGSPLANFGGGKGRAASTLRMVVADPDEAAAMIRAAKDTCALDAAAGGAMAMMQAMQRQPGGMVPPVGMTAGAPATALDPAAKIMQLKGLLDAGAISQGEYDRKKVDLLASI